MNSIKQTHPLEQMNGKNSKKLRKFELRFKFNMRNLFLALFIGFLVFSFFLSLVQTPGLNEEKPLSTVLADVKEKKSRKNRS